MDRSPATRQQTYILQGYGAIQPQWVQDCLQLFKTEQVNLRKVVLLKNGDPRCFSMLEIHFLLPQSWKTEESSSQAPATESEHPFLSQLTLTLAQQTWASQTLLPLSR